MTVEPVYVTSLAGVLRQHLDGSQVSSELIRGDRYRFIVIWDRFAGMGHPERQRIVWDVADEALSKGDLVKVGMIITIGPDEVPST